jgi:16S rRNA C967 or C1407 C5-methylase (RsmB/RsmF family)
VGKKEQKPDFYAYYQSLFGERWEALKDALAGEPVYFPLSEGLLKPYYLDEASYWAAKSLDVHPGERVLDLCAAPGGKSLVLATGLKGQGSLISNDRSSARRARLIKVLDEHLPAPLRKTVEVKGFDAASWCRHENEAYDRILLDAPCSSERHVMESPSHLAQWSPARTKHLALSAFAMLNSAFLLLKKGGTLLYSTCALSPLENDEVIDRLLDKRGDSCELLKAEAPEGESTRFGFQVWPDISGGRGPIYFAKCKRTD